MWLFYNQTNIWVHFERLSFTWITAYFFFLNAGEPFNSSMTRVTFPGFVLFLICYVIISSCTDVSLLGIFRQYQYWQHIFSAWKWDFTSVFFFRLASIGGQLGSGAESSAELMDVDILCLAGQKPWEHQWEI